MILSVNRSLSCIDVPDKFGRKLGLLASWRKSPNLPVSKQPRSWFVAKPNKSPTRFPAECHLDDYRVISNDAGCCKSFFYAHSSDRTHFFGGAGIASVFGASVHLHHPKCSALRIHQLGVAHQSSLRSSMTMMSFPISLFREAGSLINQPVTFAP